MKENKKTENKYFLNLGAGVQSSALALMLDNNYIQFPKPEFAIFADTQSEPAEVYEWLTWLKTQLSFPVYTATKGNLYEDSLILHLSKNWNVYLKNTIPVWMDRHGAVGQMQRHCTYDYKVEVIKKELRKHVKLSKGNIINQYIGISYDELIRMKDNKDLRIKNIYPLIELRLTRNDCIKYIQENYKKTPPRSACIFCPFHNDFEWKKLMQSKHRKQIIDYEDRMKASYKAITKIDGTPYLHRSLIDIKNEPYIDNNLNLFQNECEGYCGI